MAVATPPGVGHAGAAIDDLLGHEASVLFDSSSSRVSPIVSWLVATTRPALTVELGSGDGTSILSTCEAVERAGAGAKCAAVLLSVATADRGTTESFRMLMAELAGRFGTALEGYESEEACLAALDDETVGLVHVALFDSDAIGLPDVGAWQRLMAPGAILVVTTTASHVSSNFANIKRQLSEEYPSVCLSLGLTAEAVVAQKPADDVTPIVDVLRKSPFAVGAFLALYGEQVDLHPLLRDEPEPSVAVRALIGRIVQQQHAEREAFLSALRVYKEETAHLTTEVSQARGELTHQIEAARLEREHLVKEFLDRVDQLSSKISTSAARYSAELAEKDVLLEAQERRLEVYAGHAANAQSVIEDMRRSTSWRVTAPVRLLSRIFARRAVPVRPDNQPGRRVGSKS